MVERALIIGGDSLLGKGLAAHWAERDFSAAVTTRRAASDQSSLHRTLPLDLARPGEEWPDLNGFSVAVFCAANSNGPQCRQDPSGTGRINVEQTIELADRVIGNGTFLVFISTNLVFDGSQPMNKPDDPMNPMTEYARQKAEVERHLMERKDSAAIVRLGKVFHKDLRLLHDWREKAKSNRPIEPFTDLKCAPISMRTTIRALAAVAENKAGGTWHVSADSDMSYAEIARIFALSEGIPEGMLRPVAGEGLGVLEHIPRHTTLDTSSLQSAFGIRPEPAQDVVASAVADQMTSARIG